MKRLFSLVALIGGGIVAFVTVLRRPVAVKRLAEEARKRAHLLPLVEHDHAAMTHEHEHYHVTHNRREGFDEVIGEWEHLTARHTHAHNHPAITHSHAPHEDADHEHLGEAHIHDHEHPTTS